MYLFREQFIFNGKLTSYIANYTIKKNYFIDGELEGIRNFNIFAVSIYMKKWFLCQIPKSAPRNDLELLKDLVKYNAINKTLSTEVTGTFLKHTWYLSEVMIGLSFFDETIDHNVKLQMVKNG